MRAACRIPLQHGCPDIDAPVLEGQSHSVHSVAGAGWFSGLAVLPSSLLPQAQLIGIFGDAAFVENSATIATLEIEYLRNLAPAPAPAPAPQTLVLVTLGLLLAARRGRQAA